MSRLRTDLKRLLGHLPDRQPSSGTTLLTYHRVGGGSSDELDVSLPDFRAQLAELSRHRVVPLGEALDALDRGDSAPRVVLTFDDGFADLHEHAWPLLRKQRMPFTVYVASGFMGGRMSWDGATAKATGAPALSWDDLREMVDSGLCTVGNHTHHHVRPERLSEVELDRCTDSLLSRLDVVPEHFAFPWGVPVPGLGRALRARFRSAATGRVGRNLPSTDRMLLNRVPVRRTDPIEFFRAKLDGRLLPERTYAAVVATAKRAGARA